MIAFRNSFILFQTTQGYAGGPISDDCGAKLSSSGLNLVSIYGSTETGVSTVVYGPQEREKPVEWAWMTFDSMYKCRWNDQGNGTYELQFLVSVIIMSYEKKGVQLIFKQVRDILLIKQGQEEECLAQNIFYNEV